jgi:hypothetical protein
MFRRLAPLLFTLGCSPSTSGDGSGNGASANGGASGTSSATGGSNATGGTTEAGGSDTNGGAGGAVEPYANVVAVTTSGDAGAYTFSVTIESADIDCSQYADWWEVLGADGALVYRRILEHSHTDENGTTDADAPGNTFTRAGGPVSVAEDDELVVRAHMSVGGYNGAAFRGSPAAGFDSAPDVDESFAPGVETEEPLPTTCDF